MLKPQVTALPISAGQRSDPGTLKPQVTALVFPQVSGLIRLIRLIRQIRENTDLPSETALCDHKE